MVDKKDSKSYHTHLSEELVSPYFPTSSGVAIKIQSNLTTFLRFPFSLSLEHIFLDLKDLPKFMTTKSFTSSSVKVLNSHWSFEYTTLCL